MSLDPYPVRRLVAHVRIKFMVGAPVASEPAQSASSSEWRLARGNMMQRSRTITA
jgi:hypothetical protein